MKRLLQGLLLALSLSAVAAHASTPSDASLNRLAEITPYEAIFGDEIIAPLLADRNALIYSINQDDSLNEQQRKDAVKAYDDYADGLLRLFSTDAKKKELKAAYIAAAKQHYTQSEIDALIAFYGSDVGKSALKKEPNVYDSYLKAVESSTSSTLDAYAKANQVKTQDAIKRILNK